MCQNVFEFNHESASVCKITTQKLMPIKKKIIEIDEFLGTNKGLIVAEIELTDKNQEFLKPDYLGDEVTNDKKYYNSNLSKNSYKTWK